MNAPGPTVVLAAVRWVLMAAVGLVASAANVAIGVLGGVPPSS